MASVIEAVSLPMAEEPLAGVMGAIVVALPTCYSTGKEYGRKKLTNFLVSLSRLLIFIYRLPYFYVAARWWDRALYSSL